MNRLLFVMIVAGLGLTTSAVAQSHTNQKFHTDQSKQTHPAKKKKDVRRRDGRRGDRAHSSRSRNRYSHSRARRFRQGGGGYGSGYGGDYGYPDTTDYAEIYLNQSYYDDGPYGPGFYDRSLWYNWYLATQRSSQLLSSSARMIDEGMAAFRAGRYDRAAIAWVGASRKDQGDARSRIHAGHALFAVGRYDSAVKLLARGFELTPRLATSQYDIRSDYTKQSDFDDQFATLKSYVMSHPNNADAVTLLGYVIFYTKGPAAAYRILSRASEMRPKDTFVFKLLEVAKLVSPMADLERTTSDQPARSNRPHHNKPAKGQQTPKIKKVRQADHP